MWGQTCTLDVPLQFRLLQRIYHVSFVAKDEDTSRPERVVEQELLQFGVYFRQTFAVGRVHEEHDGVDRRVVRLPEAPGSGVSAEVVRRERHIADADLFRLRVPRRLMWDEFIVPVHIHIYRIIATIRHYSRRKYYFLK